MQIPQTSDTLEIAIPESRKDALAYIKEMWVRVSQLDLSHEYCIKVENSLHAKFPGDKEIKGCAYILIMTSAFLRNKNKEATLLGDQALELFRSIQNKDGEGAACVIIGGCYRSFGDSDRALNYIQKALLLISEDSMYSRYLVMGYYQGAEIFSFLNKHEDALNYYNKALQIPGIDLWLNARIYNGIGNVYLKQKKYTEASKLLLDAYSLIKDKGNKLINGRLLSDIGNYYYETKDYGLALEYENKSYEIRKELNLSDPRITNLLHFYKIYKVTGENEKAMQSLEEAFSLAKEKNLKGKLGEIYQKKVEYYEKSHEYDKALQELKNFVSTREDEMNSSFDLRINGIKAVHEVEFTRKEAEITREKNIALSKANDKINAKNKELKLVLDDLTKAKISRKAVMFTMIIGISLCLLTEAIVDPWVDSYSYNNYISLAVKAIIAISLKPIDSFYERLMIKKALK
jgi:tetratricopeptide (TPR) repeat protein